MHKLIKKFIKKTDRGEYIVVQVYGKEKDFTTRFHINYSYKQAKLDYQHTPDAMNQTEFKMIKNWWITEKNQNLPNSHLKYIPEHLRQ